MRVLAAALVAAGTLSCAARRDSGRPAATVLVASDTGGAPRRHRSRPVIPAASDALVADDAAAARAWRDYEELSWKRVRSATNLVGYLTATGLMPAEVIEDVARARLGLGDRRLDDDDVHDAVAVTAHEAAAQTFEQALWRVRGAATTLPAVAAADAYRTLSLQLESAENRRLRGHDEYEAAALRVNRHLDALGSDEARAGEHVYRRRPALH